MVGKVCILYGSPEISSPDFGKNVSPRVHLYLPTDNLVFWGTPVLKNLFEIELQFFLCFNLFSSIY